MRTGFVMKSTDSVFIACFNESVPPSCVGRVRKTASLVGM